MRTSQTYTVPIVRFERLVGYHVSETKVARKADERSAETKAYRSAFLDTPLKSKSILIGR